MDPVYPKIFRIRQKFARPRVGNVTTETIIQLERLDLGQRISPNQTVAITVGSRGIAGIAEITKGIVDHLHSLGAKPFIVPSMGSHGSATAEGQRKVIESYGVTEEYLGCPIRSSMETVVVLEAAEGFPIHFDKIAYEADHVLVCGRVKPHTRFSGDLESGLMKMMLIGLGNHAGAQTYHQAIQHFSFRQIITCAARDIIENCNIVAGVAILENAYDETAMIEAIAPEDIEWREGELLDQARKWMPTLPFVAADALLIDRIGKDISGAGMDTNVVGRKYNDHAAVEGEYPKITRIAIRGLTQSTLGTATGLGRSEYCLSRVLDQMDVEATRINALAAGVPTAAMLPLDYPSDREMLDAIFPTLGMVRPSNVRLMWIIDTLTLEQLECSEDYWEEAKKDENLEVLTEPRPIPFDENGLLPELSDWK